MSLLKGILKQTAVYWAPGTESFNAYGAPVRSAGVQISCRWENTAQEFIRPDGTRDISRAVVLVNTDLVVGGLLMLGTLDETEESGFPSDPRQAGALVIVSVQKVPTLDGKENVRTVLV